MNGWAIILLSHGSNASIKTAFRFQKGLDFSWLEKLRFPPVRTRQIDLFHFPRSFDPLFLNKRHGKQVSMHNCSRLKYMLDKGRSLAKMFFFSFQESYVDYASILSTSTTMRLSFFFWLTFSLASISKFSPADFDPLQTLALQANDAFTTAPTPELVVDDSTLGHGIGAQDDSGKIPVNSVEGNQQQQQEGLFKANTSNCRRSPPSSGGAERRRRDEVDYCRNDDAPTIRPTRFQQEGEVRPSGNLGGQSKPGNNLLVKPEEARPEWAPSLSDGSLSKAAISSLCPLRAWAGL